MGSFNKFLSVTSPKEENHEPSNDAKAGQDEGYSDPKLPDEYTPYNWHEYAQYESRENDTPKLKCCCKNIGRLVK